MKHALLTGATGLLGRYLVRDLSAQGMPVAVLARSDGTESAAERVNKSLLPLKATAARVLEGDISQPDLGLSADDRAWVGQHCDRIIHSAASLTFHCSDRKRDPWWSNFNGTQHVAQLARDAGIDQFHHISTAYICGNREGTALERERNIGQTFRNDYEESKCATEDWLHGQDWLKSLTVYRPAIIVGDSQTGYTSTYHGPYRIIQFAGLIAQQIPPDEDDGKRHVRIRLALDPDSQHNLVPVDWVSAVIARGVAEPRLHGRTYHLTPVKPSTYRELADSLIETFHFEGVQLIGDKAPGDLNEIESAFYDYIHTHSEYLDSEPSFDNAHCREAFPDLPCPAVDRELLKKLVAFALADQFGKRRRRG